MVADSLALGHSLPKQVLNLGVHAAQIITRPDLQITPEGWVDAQ
jgi:hypothetical protein